MIDASGKASPLGARLAAILLGILATATAQAQVQQPPYPGQAQPYPGSAPAYPNPGYPNPGAAYPSPSYPNAGYQAPQTGYPAGYGGYPVAAPQAPESHFFRDLFTGTLTAVLQNVTGGLLGTIGGRIMDWFAHRTQNQAPGYNPATAYPGASPYAGGSPYPAANAYPNAGYVAANGTPPAPPGYPNPSYPATPAGYPSPGYPGTAAPATVQPAANPYPVTTDPNANSYPVAAQTYPPTANAYPAPNTAYPNAGYPNAGNPGAGSATAGYSPMNTAGSMTANAYPAPNTAYPNAGYPNAGNPGAGSATAGYYPPTNTAGTMTAYAGAAVPGQMYGQPAPQVYDVRTGQLVTGAANPYATRGIGMENAIYAGIAYEVDAIGADGHSVPINTATYEFHTGDQFKVYYRPSLPGHMEIYNVNPQGQQTLIDSSTMAAGQMVALGPYQFTNQTGDEKLRLVLSPCSSPQLLAATRDIVRADAPPQGGTTSPALRLGSCDAPATRGVDLHTRDIEKVGVEGTTSFALDPLSGQELSSGNVTPREVSLVFHHR